MRKIIASAVAAGAALMVGPAVSADIPYYPDIEIPEVDYGLGGSFYLRGSAALNIHWAPQAEKPLIDETYPITQLGFGYSWGAGFGYETGDGLRFDATIDSVDPVGLQIIKEQGEPDDGTYTLLLRSTIGLANVYYDFGLGGDGFGASGFDPMFGYLGAGVGLAFNRVQVNSPPTFPSVPGANISPAAAIMAGVGYDMGSWVADLGYRGLYIHQVNNSPTTDPDNYYEINHSLIHELRSTVRYRFN